ncbi:hypothetical protein V8G54_018742 [Vigna mungo]|uniref:ATPase dynein-related AAA domain-containing protein n=1 Tax=Vigna mungo TaxID=3915 RepID=A0AAQ3N9Q8_VIGMU
MQRLYFLVERCYIREPVLLVGETGGGKTTGFRPIRERSALISGYKEIIEKLKKLKTCTYFHMELSSDINDASSTLDLLSVMIRKCKEGQVCLDISREELKDLEQIKCDLNGLHQKWQSIFVWQDGPLVEAMRDGDLFHVDEISLADDSVLERLNSVLEPERMLSLAEKGGTDLEKVTAHSNFFVLATMNPGGDYGKKELSPALRNRFTEIWVPPVNDLDELQGIALKSLCPEYQERLSLIVDAMIRFFEWFNNLHPGRMLTVRDLISWVDFFITMETSLGPEHALLHGVFLVLLDGLSLDNDSSSTSSSDPDEEANICLMANSDDSTSQEPSKFKKSMWHLDSGRSRLMTGDNKRFLNFQKKNQGLVTYGNNNKGKITGVRLLIMEALIVDNGMMLHNNINHFRILEPQQLQFHGPAQATPHPPTASEPKLKELLRQMTAQNMHNQLGQMTTQLTEEQSHVSKESPFQVVQLPDDSHELTTAPSTSPPSYVPTLAPEETDEELEDQTDISKSFEIGRPTSPFTTLPIFREVEVNIPLIDSVVDDYVDDRYVDDYIVDEHAFNSPSLHDENHLLLSHLNVCSPCTEHESELAVDIVSTFEIDSCSKGGTHEFDQHTPMVEDKGADSLKINRHQLNLLINNYCFLDPAVEDISLLDQIWRMKQFFLKTSLLNPMVEEISLKVQNWQLPP